MPVLDSAEFAGYESLPERLRCDVCIIGSGPAGLTIARELSGTRLRVTVLESGGNERQEAVDELNEIENVGWPRVLDQWAVRNRVVGGSSATWKARCAPFDDIDFEYRDWIPYSGWPIEPADLAPYIDRSASHLGLGAGNGLTDDRIWELTGHPRMTSGPAPDPDKLRPMFWQFGRDPVNQYDRTRFSRSVDGLGHNITLVTNATVVAVNATESAAAVKSVEFAAADGHRWTLPAATIVVCAGGIENARLLLASNDVAPAGLGNDHDLVGRFLMDHLRGTVGNFGPQQVKAVLAKFGSFKSAVAGNNTFQHGMRLSPAIQRAEQLLNCSAWVEEYIAPDDPWEAIIQFLRRESRTLPDPRLLIANSGLLAYGLKEHFIAHRALPRKLAGVALWVMSEQEPNPDSRVTLADRRDRLGMPISRVDWRVSEVEARTLRRTAELMVEQFARVGIDPPELADWVRDGATLPDSFQDVAHPTGTTRMADSPAQGVVDARCEVHGVHGLFVAGSSVFPTAGHANPTQLIVALAARLADTLTETVAAASAPASIASAAADGLDGAEPDDGPPRVLVTGASGFIGRHVVSELLEHGYRVRAVTSRPVSPGAPGDRLEWRQLDFQRSLDFGPLVRGCTAVIHLAAEIADTGRMEQSNVAATRALAEAGELAGVKFFCYTSSVAVYGSSRRRRVDEESPVLTVDRDVRDEYWDDEALRCYGRTKLGGELAVKSVARGVDYVIVRPTVVIDVPGLVALADWGKVRKQRAAARHAHHVYVKDVADAMVWLLEDSLRDSQRQPGVRTFNLSQDDAPVRTYGQLFSSAYRATGDASWRIAPMPPAVEWLWVILRARRLMLRQPFGRTLFSGKKLRAAGYEFPYGMPQAIAEFQHRLIPPATEERATAAASGGQEASVETAADGPLARH